MDNLKMALTYLEKGISVMPLWSPEMVKKSPSKGFLKKLEEKMKEISESENPFSKEEIYRKLFIDQCKSPVLFEWKQYQERLPSVEEVTQWFTENPSANIAIITGMVSNLVVFDLDSEEAEKYAQSRGGFPITARAKTGKGRHIYMRHPGIATSNKINLKLRIDIKADRGYVVAPPSVHGSGIQYQWEEGFSIFDLEPAECTSWMLDHFRGIVVESSEGKKEENRKAGSSNKARDSERNELQTEYAQILKNGCSEGERNQTATRLIGHLLKKGIDDSEAWQLITTWNLKNKPPIDLNELKKTFESVSAMESDNDHRTIFEIDSLLDNPQLVIKEYEENYVRIPFGGTNLTSLEKKMNGGLIGGRLYVLGGIPSSGKTVLANNVADNICLNNTPVLFFSYDDGRIELRYRTLARLCEMSIQSFNLKSQPKIRELSKDPQIRKVMNLKYVVEEILPVEEWHELVEQIRKKSNRPPVIIVDYLRKLRTKKKFQDERLRIDDIVSNLTSLAKSQNIPIIAVSELGRDSYKFGQKLGMGSFKETGMIEYEASWLGILAPVEETDGGYQLKQDWENIIHNDGTIALIVFKAKRGTGFTGKIPLRVDKEYMTVTDRTANKTNKKASSMFG